VSTDSLSRLANFQTTVVLLSHTSAFQSINQSNNQSINQHTAYNTVFYLLQGLTRYYTTLHEIASLNIGFCLK